MEYTNKKYYCPHCSEELVQDIQLVTNWYDFACVDCDEDFYAFEVRDYHYEWQKEEEELMKDRTRLNCDPIEYEAELQKRNNLATQ